MTFGFDTTIDYDKLTERNTFEYLCTSVRLKPWYISYCGFKSQHAKNKLHEKFNSYLVEKSYAKNPYDISFSQQHKNEFRMYLQDAVSFFGKEKEYSLYKKNQKLLDCVYKKTELLKGMRVYHNERCKFKLFIGVHGVYKIAEMDDETFVKEWDEFLGQN